MGVTGLWEYMQKFAESISPADLARKKLAVDGTAWIIELHRKGCVSPSKAKSLSLAFFQRTCRLMEAAIEPIIVFDTAKTIDLDSSRAPARRSNGRKAKGKGDHSHRLMLLKELDDLKALLDKMDIRYVEAACDSVAQCGQLEMDNLVEGCVAKDMNYFLFGGRNLTLVGSIEKVQLFSMDMITETQGLNRHRLIALAILLGCDTYERGIQRVGMVTGLEIIAEFSLVDDDHPQTILDRFRSYCSHELESSTNDSEMKSKLYKFRSYCSHELESSTNDSEMKSKLYKSGFNFPSSFPNSDAVAEAINSYLLPSVNVVTADSLTGSLCDPAPHVRKPMEEFLVKLLKLEPKRITKDLDDVFSKRSKVLSEMRQQKIDKYMTPPLSSSSLSSTDSAIELTESVVSNSSSGSRSRYRPLVCDKQVSEDDGIYCSKREYSALEALKKKMSLYSPTPLILEASLRGDSEDTSRSASAASSRQGPATHRNRRRPAVDTIDSSPVPKISRDELTTTIEGTSHQPSIIIEGFRPGKPNAVC
uniref:Flap endonuclease GEN-like 2 n=1 Tax=Steinernema glaseri TaxID=37863 RepID=A0A1I7Z726_9BILA